MNIDDAEWNNDDRLCNPLAAAFVSSFLMLVIIAVIWTVLR